ncbi:regulatory iron-sulfur-containing complex subunit RicT [Desulfobulbus sp.]|jgi:cell fate regulator YaaT (PSP1 superfamily)|uniref:PSP1 domain-containing protein n=1 Tax=Desulfobulbus sp. TaxID=895 RepID=UPI002852A9FA|nr:regulatory iron-sulfur-containing complex subunit RicT [Desulfobulbus sp.]
MIDSPSEPQPVQPSPETPTREARGEEAALHYYKFRFREQGQEFTGHAQLADLARGDQVMIRAEQGAEPAKITGRFLAVADVGQTYGYRIHRRASAEEKEKYVLLPQLEHDAFRLCQRQIERLALPMHMVRVERFFNGSKIIFYFTAESRVDFRELVKVLVQEFRTRVEMRQIGVRHETQMIGGLGPCGRELCCTSFLNKFDSVSIKMAKTQDLPLNPAKISGLCNRLLCCLTYEYETYKTMKKGMPRVGRQIQFEGRLYQVNRLIPLLGKVAAVAPDGEERLFSEEEWRAADPIPKSTGRKGPVKKSRRTTIDIWGVQEGPAEDDE